MSSFGFVDDEDGDCNDGSFRTCESLPDELAENNNNKTMDDTDDEYKENTTLHMSNKNAEMAENINTESRRLVWQQDTAEEDEDEGDNELPSNSFSMLFVAKSFKEHCLSFGVFGLQMLILILIMLNLLQQSDRPLVTTMNVPVDVPLTVRLSQYIACLVSVFTADDLIEGALNVGKRIIHKSHLTASMVRERRFTISTSLTSRQTKWEISK